MQDLQTRLATANGKVVKLQEEMSKSREAEQQVAAMLVLPHHRKPILASAGVGSDAGSDTPLPGQAAHQVCSSMQLHLAALEVSWNNLDVIC